MKQHKILVTGGLGFIGSHTVVCLNESGYMPVIVDNLHNSRIEVLSAITKLIGYTPEFIQGDVSNKSLISEIFKKHRPDAQRPYVLQKAVGESVDEPLMYYHNNVVGLISLLEVMKQFDCNKLVFSSSCTVYGEPEQVPVKESNHTMLATSPYGATKQMGEVILKDNTWCNVQCLRYFNPVGAHESSLIGELPLGVPNNLIPYLTQTAAGIRPQLTVHGGDYNTPDGTCIRDYIHVMDLAGAHVAAINRLFTVSEKPLLELGDPSTDNFEVFNIGTGKGYSVLEVIKAFEDSTGMKVPHVVGPRRNGDIVSIWADTTKANEVLGWHASRNLETMMLDAWNWQLANGS
jgi:UDP-glucose 4-epimerase